MFLHPQLGLKMFMECSAKTGENVDVAYIELARMVKARLIDSNPDFASSMPPWLVRVVSCQVSVFFVPVPRSICDSRMPRVQNFSCAPQNVLVPPNWGGQTD